MSSAKVLFYKGETFSSFQRTGSEIVTKLGVYFHKVIVTFSEEKNIMDLLLNCLILFYACTKKSLCIFIDEKY